MKKEDFVDRVILSFKKVCKTKAKHFLVQLSGTIPILENWFDIKMKIWGKSFRLILMEIDEMVSVSFMNSGNLWITSIFFLVGSVYSFA